MAWVGPAVALAAVAVVVLLTVRPLRAVLLMQQAQQRPQHALELFQSAAAADPLDPLPVRAAAHLRYRLAHSDPARSLGHLQAYEALSREAVRRHPLDHGFWRSLALARMYLATATGDFARVEEAVRDMQRALALNPQWPKGWLELAGMAAVEGNGPDRPALLRTALEAIEKARVLEEDRPAGVPPALGPQDRAELQRLHQQVSARLKAVP